MNQWEGKSTMLLGIILGLISGVTLCVGVLALQKKGWGRGTIQIILSLAAPALVLWWCSRKRYFAFGGSDWEFLVQSAWVDRMTFPWIILFVYLLMIAFFIATVIWLKKKQTF
jgi:hypothetical protein